jgi:hypothetical protein
MMIAVRCGLQRYVWRQQIPIRRVQPQRIEQLIQFVRLQLYRLIITLFDI